MLGSLETLKRWHYGALGVHTPEESYTYTSLQGILYVLKQVETVGAIGVSAYLRMLR